jgi:hypothetical protein
MLLPTSSRKAVLHRAASSKVRGGTKRVLLRPAIEAFAMTPIPQVEMTGVLLRATVVRMTMPPYAPIMLVSRGAIKESDSCCVASLLLADKMGSGTPITHS